MTVKIGINGFGRIGRNIVRVATNNKNVEVVAVNDLTDAAMLAHLLKYDSVHGKLDETVEAKADAILVGGKKIHVSQEIDPAEIDWKKHDVDIVIEATGRFMNEEARKHLQAGAKKVILTAPGSSADLTLVLGVNEGEYDPEKHAIISNASCTTNCLAPLAQVLHNEFGIQKGLMTTIHAYTNDQQILDLPHKDYRRARAAAENIIPTSTGAAKVVGQVLPGLQGKLNGMAVRVPVSDGSVVDLVCELDKKVGREEVNQALKRASENELKGIMSYSEEPLVSTDIVGDQHSTIIDGLSTMVIDDTMVKVIAWYDNEMGYSARCVDLADYLFKAGL